MLCRLSKSSGFRTATTTACLRLTFTAFARGLGCARCSHQVRHYTTDAPPTTTATTDPFDVQSVENSYRVSDDEKFEGTFKTRFQEPAASRSSKFSKLPGDWNCPHCGFMNFRRQFRCRQCNVGQRPQSEAPSAASTGGAASGNNVEWVCACGMPNAAVMSVCTSCQLPRDAKSGDWQCPCGKTNYQSVMVCVSCGGSKNGDAVKTIIEGTDWICSKCKTHNFKRRETCRECLAPRAGNEIQHDDANVTVIHRKGPMQQGDWHCPRCGFVNFRSRVECMKCMEQRPIAHASKKPMVDGAAIGTGTTASSRVLPGDWTCPKCAANNFRSRSACFKCQTLKPATADAQ